MAVATSLAMLPLLHILFTLSAQLVIAQPGTLERLANPGEDPAPPAVPDRAEYTCAAGRGCCDFTCETGENCVLAAGSGLFIPSWWLTSAGFESCAQKVSRNYDFSTKCSQALPVYATCGLKQRFACGYGLACVAKSISYAQCLPVCGRTGGLGSPTLAPYFLNNVTSGAHSNTSHVCLRLGEPAALNLAATRSSVHNCTSAPAITCNI